MKIVSLTYFEKPPNKNYRIVQEVALLNMRIVRRNILFTSRPCSAEGSDMRNRQAKNQFLEKHNKRSLRNLF